MKVKFLNLIPDNDLLGELTEAYNRVMHSGYFVGGKEVEAFEQEWADYCGAKYCISCGSGQSALELLLKAYSIGYGDKVIVPSWTAIPTWKAVLSVGATLRPVDVNPDTFLMEIDENYLATISQHIKAIMPVHLYGYRAKSDYETWSKIPIINDACQAHGLKNLGIAAWSFYPTKNLGAYGDGGAITTDNQETAELVRLYRDSSRLDPLQAAFLRVKLKYLDEKNGTRYRNALEYELGLHQLGRKYPDLQPQNYLFNQHSTNEEIDEYHKYAMFHQYVIRIKERDLLKAHLTSRGIETMIHYPIPPHRKLIGVANGKYPNADRLAQEVLSLPITCSQEQVEYVCEVINEFYS